MVAAHVEGLQTNAVPATSKHFVRNDQENERTAADPVVSLPSGSYGQHDRIHVAEGPRFTEEYH
jgi:hypothetical protein